MIIYFIKIETAIAITIVIKKQLYKYIFKYYNDDIYN